MLEMNVSAEEVKEVAMDMVDEVPEEKKKLIRTTKRMTCTECGGTEAFFVPLYNKVICMNCYEIPEVEPESLTPMDYISDEVVVRANAADKNEKKMRLVYSDPSKHPMTEAPGRNDPCACGSGNKFKKCCLGTFQKSRNDTALELYEEQKNKILLSIANTSKMVNMIRAYLIAHPEITDANVADINFKPFKNLSGEVADINILTADARDVMAQETTDNDHDTEDEESPTPLL